MQETSFFQLANTLEDKEWKAFFAFVSGIYSKQKIQIRLLNYLHANRSKKKKWENISAEQAYAETFAHQMETAKQKKKLLNTFSDLYNWLVDYLIWKDIKNDEFIRKIFTAEIYRKRNLNSKSLQILSTTKKWLLKNPILDFWKPLKLMLISHLLTYNAVVNDKRYRITEILDAAKYLDEFYFLAKLRYSASIFSFKNVEKEKTPILLLKEVQKEVTKPAYKTNEHIQLYYWICQLSIERSAEAYDILKERFFNFSFPDKNEGLDVATFLVNHNAHLTRLGHIHSVQDCLKIFQVSLEKSLHIINGEINSTSFQNISNVASFLKDFDWALQFIKEYGPYLPKAERKDVIAISYARVFSEEQECHKALEQLRKISSKVFTIEVVRRLLQIRCFYDLKENKTLIRASCTNMMAYLDRQEKIAPLIILSYKNFLEIMYKLLRAIPKIELLDLISKTEVVTYKSWLKERIAALEE